MIERFRTGPREENGRGGLRALDYDPTVKFFNKPQKNEIKRRHNGRCAHPDHKANPVPKKQNGIQVHHRVPLSRQGSDTNIDNGVPLCQPHHQIADQEALQNGRIFNPQTKGFDPISEVPNNLFVNEVNPHGKTI